MKKTLLLLSFIFLTLSVNCQISFHRMYGGDRLDVANDVAEMSDSGFLVVGTSGSFNIGHADAFLMRTDKYGSLLWSKPYGGIENDGANALEYLENFGAYLSGRTTSSSGDFDAWITFVNDQGDVLWEKTYSGPNWEEITKSSLTQDSGLVVGVKRYGTGTLDYDYSLMRLDQSGDTIWSIESSEPGDEEVTNIVKYQDSMFLISSNHWDEIGERNYGFIELIHENGSLVWSDTVQVSPGSLFLNGFVVSNDTLFAVGGYKLNDTTTFNRMRHVRFLPMAENGEILTLTSNNGGELYDETIVQIPNSPFKYSTLRFFDYTVGTPPYHDFFVALNSYVLDPISYNVYSYTYGEDRLKNGIPTQDGGAIFVGFQSIEAGEEDVSLVKIGPNFDFPTLSQNPLSQQLVGQEELDLSSLINIYPNPTNGIVKIDSDNYPLDQCRLLDSSGKILLSKSISQGNAWLSTSNLERGVYLMQLLEDSTVIVTKRIVVL